MTIRPDLTWGLPVSISSARNLSIYVVSQGCLVRCINGWLFILQQEADHRDEQDPD